MRLSHSRIDVFKNCKRWFWYSYIKNIQPSITDTRHLRRGSTFHEVAEYIIKDKPEDLKDVHIKFLETWMKYKLDEDFLEEKDKTYLMLVNLFNNRPDLTSTEYKIFSNEPEFVGYIDGINTFKDEIVDYKTSTYNDEDPYKEQLGRYSLFYWKKFDRIPKCEVLYVKYSPFKRTSYTFTVEEMLKYEQEIVEINKYIEENKNNIRKFPCIRDETHNCHVFCPYKTMCFNMEKEVSIKLIIQGNYITIDGEMNPLLVKGINTKFSYELKNAHFIRKNNPGFDGMVHFYNQRKQTLPIGFLKGLTKTITDYSEYKKLKLNLQIEDKRVFNEEKIEYKELKTQLRNYQIEAVDAYLKEKISMLEIATGGGKSLVMAEIIKRLGYKTLIVVTRLELLNQLKAVLEKELETEVGVIGGSIYNPKHITIGTIQTLVKDLRKHREYLASVRFSIIDECHHINRNSFWRLSQCLINTENRLGTSGTIKRTDGDDMYLTAVNGNIVYNLNAEKLIGMGFLVKPQIIFIKDYLSKEQIEVLKNRSNLGLVNEKEKYNLFYESFIMNNEIRNDIVKRIVEKNKDKQILIITKRIEHANHLAEITGGNLLYGSTEKDIRKDLLGDFKNGKIKLLIGTIGIFQEGLDLVNLDILINTTGNKSDIASIQVLGRLLRKMEGKTTCVYYDFIDESRFMRSASRSRIKAFKDENHNIDIIGVDAI